MSKHRITISLSDTTVKKVDQLIDKKKIRNRSHAIEHLIQKSLLPSLKTAIILAGEKKPKKDDIRTLTMINDRPLIFYTLDLLHKHGVGRVIIITNEFGKKIEKAVGNGERWGLDIMYIYEEKPQGTAGAVKLAESFVSNDSFFVIAGDILTNIDLGDLAAFHQQSEKIATMAVKPRPAQAAYDMVFLQGNHVVDFKHSTKDQVMGIVNAGVYVFEPSIFSYIPEKIPATFEDHVFPHILKQSQLNAFTFQGVWYDISLDKNYKQVLPNLDKK